MHRCHLKHHNPTVSKNIISNVSSLAQNPTSSPQHSTDAWILQHPRQFEQSNSVETHILELIKGQDHLGGMGVECSCTYLVGESLGHMHMCHLKRRNSTVSKDNLQPFLPWFRSPVVHLNISHAHITFSNIIAGFNNPIVSKPHFQNY